MTMLGVGTLSFDDFILLSAGLCALQSNEVDGEAIHLEAGPTGRRWMVDSQHGQLRIQRSERPEPGSFQGYLPISDRLRHIAGCLTDETIELAVADDDALVVTSGPNVAVIDLVERATAQFLGWCLGHPAASTASDRLQSNRPRLDLARPA